MSEDPGSGSDEVRGPLPQHPFVERRKPDPSQPAQRMIDLVGLPGDSDRPGYQRLYLTAKLDYYAEFLIQDIVSSEALPADKSPFPGLEATRVSVRRDATIHYTRVRSPQPVDEFDLDVRLGTAGVAAPSPAFVTNTCGDRCPTVDGFSCAPTQCHTCYLTGCGQNTCNTCAGQQTCPCTLCFIVGWG